MDFKQLAEWLAAGDGETGIDDIELALRRAYREGGSQVTAILSNNFGQNILADRLQKKFDKICPPEGEEKTDCTTK